MMRNHKTMIKNIFISLCILSVTFSCDTKKLTEIPDTQFIGTWKFESNTIYNGIVLKIQKNNKGELKGIVKELNDNKLVNLFMDTNFVLIGNISRNSNFEFSVTENRVAKELFGLYKLETSDVYNAQFANDNLIVLDKGKVDPAKATIKLKRIK